MTDQDKPGPQHDESLPPKASPMETDADETSSVGGRGSEDDVKRADTEKFKDAAPDKSDR